MEIKGIDISAYKKGMKLNKGTGFCILRAGFTGWGGDGTTKYKDETFEGFYNKCKSLGIPVGAYWFSCANTYDKGKSEAEYMYNNCLKGKQFDYPIYIDVEDSHHQSGNKRGVTDAIKGFCEYLEERKFYVGIYGSDISTFQEKVYIDELGQYDKWVARYGSKPKYVKGYQMWQYSEDGTYNGYDQVDLDISYMDYPTIIKEAGLNGYGDTPPEPSFLPPRGYYQKGDSGENVEKIDDFYMTKVRGNYFGEYTYWCVKAFQHINHLEEDGNIGPITLGKMKEQGLNQNIRLPQRGWFTKGDSSDDVAIIDNFLCEKVKGNYYGDYTENCTKALQTIGKQDGIYDDAIDGCFGAKTLRTAEYYGFHY